MNDLKQTKLTDRITASILCSAVGDAMGGPVEGWSYQKIEAEYGIVKQMLPYKFPPGYHNHFRTDAGTVTDDTRLRHLIAKAIICRGQHPHRGDLAHTIIQAYHQAKSDLERGFLEEYALGAIYGEEKLIWGGQMTNGFIMANSPLGLICPCDPEKAFALSYEIDFISDGYARYSSAMGAAAVASAFRPHATPVSIVQDVLKSSHAHRIEGPLTRNWQWYDHVFTLNERLINVAVEIAQQKSDVFEVREYYYRDLHVSDLGSEAAQTLAVALGMWVASKGDLQKAIIGCVNYGRDNDSYASLAGAIAGAACGTGDIPSAWRDGVVSANPEIDFCGDALALAKVAVKIHQKQSSVLEQVSHLLR